MTQQHGPLGIITAIPQELEHLEDREDGSERIGGLDFHRGRIEGHAAVFVEGGMGKVNAGVVATLLADRYRCRALVFCGVAGGLDPALGIGDVVIATRLVQHDYGAVIAGALVTYHAGQPPLPGMSRAHGWDMAPALREKLARALDGLRLPSIAAGITGGAARQPHVRFGTIATGDAFINCDATRIRLHQEFAAHAVEMEGAAVAQVGQRFGLPWLVVRCLSDLAGADSHVNFQEFLPVAARSAALVLRRLVHAL